MIFPLCVVLGIYAVYFMATATMLNRSVNVWHFFAMGTLVLTIAGLVWHAGRTVPAAAGVVFGLVCFGVFFAHRKEEA